MYSNHLPLSPFPQGCTNITEVARCNENLAPYVLVIGDIQEPSQAFIVVDRQIVTEVNIIDIPLVLLAAFFVFNIHYPKGSNNFYTFMEAYTLGFSLSKASPTVKHFVAGLGTK